MPIDHKGATASQGGGSRHFVLPGSDHDKHYVSLDLGGAGSKESALRRYEAAVERLVDQSVSVVYERAFGALSMRASLEELRRATYERLKAPLPPLTYVEGLPQGPALTGSILYGIKATKSGLVSVRGVEGAKPRSGGATLVETPRIRALHIGSVTDDGEEARPAEWRFSQALDRVGGLIEQHGFKPTDIVRTWIYLSDIRRDYTAFNDARRRFFAANGIDFGPSAAMVPASTGIEGRSTGDTLITMDVYCVDRSKSHCTTKRVYNSLQPEADGDTYPMKPAFGRGIVLDDGEHRELQISGTASINERGQSVFLEQPAEQIRTTLENVQNLLAGERFTVDDICQATYHFKNTEMLACFREISAEMGFGAVQGPCVITNICRPELLFEIDGIALAQSRLEVSK